MAQNQGSTITLPLGSQVRSQNPLTLTPPIRSSASQTFISANNYSTVQPVNYNLQNANILPVRESILPSGVPMQSHVRASRVLEPIYAGQINTNRQTNTVYAQPNVTYTRPGTINVQPVVPNVPQVQQIVRPSQTFIQPMAQSYVRPVVVQQTLPQRITYEAPPQIIHTPVVVRQIVQPKVEEPVVEQQIKVEQKVIQLPPEVIRTVEHERPHEAIVETARQSRWQEHYTKQKVYTKPPITASGPEQATVCKPWLWGIIGLLALAGLITGLVLALKGNSGYGTPQATNTTQSQGIPPVSNYQPIQNTNSSGNSTIISNGTVTQTPIYTDILVTPPEVIQKPGLQTITTSNTTIMVPTNGTSVISNTTNTNTFTTSSTSKSPAVIDVSESAPSTNTTATTSATISATTSTSNSTNNILASNSTKATTQRHSLKRAYIN